jgi:hypothetical protein
MNCNMLEPTSCSYGLGVTNFIKHCQVENKVFLINYCVMPPTPHRSSPLFTAVRISIEKTATFFPSFISCIFFCISIQITKLFGLTHCSGGTKYSLFIDEFQLVTAKVNYISIYRTKVKGHPITIHESQKGSREV